MGSMNLSRLKKARDYEVQAYLSEELQLTPYQKQKMKDNEFVRWSKYEFFEEKEEVKTSLIWRITIIALPVYIVLIWLTILFKWLITGDRYLGEVFLQKFHYKWMNKINVNL